MTRKSFLKLKTGQVISRKALLDFVASEHQEQTLLFKWAALQYRHRELALMYANPNQMVAKQIGRKKAEGLKAGVPDICLPVARGPYHGLYIELKVGKNKPTNEQDWWLRELRRQGYCAIVCYGWTKASQEITSYLNLTR